MRKFLLTILVLPLFGAATGCPGPEPVTPHAVGMGSALYLNRALDNEGRINTMCDLAAQAGVEWTREEFHWNLIEPTRGEYSDRVLAKYDRAIGALAGRGIRVLGLLSYENGWSSGIYSPFTDEQRADYARFAAKMAERYRDTVTHWEIWNEPDLDRFWHPKPDATAYGLLVKAASEAIRAVNPAAKIVAGATSGVKRDFLLEMLDAAGVASVDILSFHPYCGDRAWDRSDEPDDVRKLKAELKKRDINLPLWSTEFGYTTTENHNGVSYDTQGPLFVRAFVSQFAEGVENIITYDFADDGTEPDDNEQHFGLVEKDLTPKPALTAFGVMTSFLKGSTVQERRMDCGITSVRFTARDGRTVWVAWDSWPTVENHVMEPSLRRRFGVPGGFNVMAAYDAMGNPVSIENNSVTTSGEPVYIVGETP